MLQTHQHSVKSYILFLFNWYHDNKTIIPGSQISTLPHQPECSIVCQAPPSQVAVARISLCCKLFFLISKKKKLVNFHGAWLRTLVPIHDFWIIFLLMHQQWSFYDTQLTMTNRLKLSNLKFFKGEKMSLPGNLSSIINLEAKKWNMLKNKTNFQVLENQLEKGCILDLLYLHPS